MKIKKTFRLEEETVFELEEYARREGMSLTEALEGAIHGAIHGAIRCHTPDGEPGADWRALYLAEKERADAAQGKAFEYADAVAALSAKVADSLQAAQVTQALGAAPGDRGGDPPRDRRPWWRRLWS